MGLRVGYLVLALPLLAQGCLLDIAPPREPLEEAWTAHMLAGEYGQWSYGEKVGTGGPDEIRSSPLGAKLTRYGILIIDQSTLGGGGWSISGGMVARVTRPDASIELFGKEIARVHGLKRTVGPGDYSYDFFLVVRPNAAQRGRLIKQWRFPREALAGRPAPSSLEGFPKMDGYLSFDEQSKTATVRITGLVQPFAERVDLSRELP